MLTILEKIVLDDALLLFVKSRFKYLYHIERITAAATICHGTFHDRMVDSLLSVQLHKSLPPRRS